MENLNIALIGCGMIGREHIERIQNRIRGAKIVAVCDVFEEGAKKGAEIAGAGTKIYTDFNEAINDPDVNAVVVTTPGQFHKGPVLAAIKAGKPVFSEKPLANTAADGKEIVEAEMAGGKHLVQVGFMRRYDRGYRQVKELIDSGKFGAWRKLLNSAAEIIMRRRSWWAIFLPDVLRPKPERCGRLIVPGSNSPIWHGCFRLMLRRRCGRQFCRWIAS